LLALDEQCAQPGHALRRLLADPHGQPLRNVLQIAGPARLRECFEMLTGRSARLLNLTDYGLVVGNPADIVVIDAATPEQAIAEIRQPLAVYKRGRRRSSAPARTRSAKLSMRRSSAWRCARWSRPARRHSLERRR